MKQNNNLFKKNVDEKWKEKIWLEIKGSPESQNLMLNCDLSPSTTLNIIKDILWIAISKTQEFILQNSDITDAEEIRQETAEKIFTEIETYRRGKETNGIWITRPQVEKIKKKWVEPSLEKKPREEKGKDK